MIKRFYGLNIAVKDFDEAVKKYSAVLGVEPKYMSPDDFAVPGHKGAALLIGDVAINIISGEAGTSAAKFVENRGDGVFLLSVEVTDVEKDQEELAKKGVQFVSAKPVTSRAGGKVNWAHPKSMNGVQWEFYQLPEKG